MLYDIGFAIFSIFYLPALIFKGKLHADFVERFGKFSPDKRKALEAAKGAIWIQAVSVGEVSLCKSLIPKIRSVFPDKKIVLSTITKTGNDLARKLFSGDAVIFYFPLDFSFIVKKVMDLIQPAIYVMIETEIWPNILEEMSRRNIPSILINGRISDRSIGKYKLASPFLKKTLGKIALFCMQSDLDGSRIISIGAPKNRVRVTGNMKFDVEIITAPTQELRDLLGLKPKERLFVAGSTHPGEEMSIIEAYKELIKEFPDLRLLMAPRHVENFPLTESYAKELGFETFVFSDINNGKTKPAGSPIFIMDVIGHLKEIYSVAELVFIGGSLAKHGGQNPIEPAIFEKAILFGPHMFNFKDIAGAFIKGGAAIEVLNKEELILRSRELLIDAKRRMELGRNAKKVVLSGRGATLRNMQAIESLIKN